MHVLFVLVFVHHVNVTLEDIVCSFIPSNLCILEVQ